MPREEKSIFVLVAQLGLCRKEFVNYDFSGQWHCSMPSYIIGFVIITWHGCSK
jgi:hypothetical protein